MIVKPVHGMLSAQCACARGVHAGVYDGKGGCTGKGADSLFPRCARRDSVWRQTPAVFRTNILPVYRLDSIRILSFKGNISSKCKQLLRKLYSRDLGSRDVGAKSGRTIWEVSTLQSLQLARGDVRTCREVQILVQRPQECWIPTCHILAPSEICWGLFLAVLQAQKGNNCFTE